MSNNIKIINKYSKPVHVKILENLSRVKEEKYEKVSDISVDLLLKLVKEGKISIPGAKTAESEFSTDLSAKVKDYHKNFSDRKLEWTEFVVPGELQIGPGETNFLALKGEDNYYYLTVTIEGNLIADQIKRSSPTIIIGENGLIQDLHQVEAEEIKRGSRILLQLDGRRKFIAPPVLTGLFKQMVTATVSDIYLQHEIEFIESDRYAPDVTCRLKSTVRLEQFPDDVYMYASDGGWVYYDKFRRSGIDFRKQTWRIHKVSTHDVDDKNSLYSGDKVRIQNVQFPNSYLNFSGKWASSPVGEGAIWIIRKNASFIDNQ